MDRRVENIYNDILELSDVNIQRKLWLNEANNTGLISSFTELMCRLFDDNNLDGFIDDAVPGSEVSSEVLIAAPFK
jgi:hypothetical protein